MTETAFSLSFAPLVPIPLLITLTALAVLIGGLGLWRRANGSLLRCLVLAALLILLANPSIIEELRRPQPDIAVLAVDRSASQKLGSRREATDAATTALLEKLGAFPDLEVRQVEIGGTGVGPMADRGTALFSGIEEALSDIPPGRLAGVISITDGQAHDQPRGEPRGPLHMVVTGEEGEIDRRLVVVQAPTFGLVGKPVAITLRVEDFGFEAPGPVPVTIRVDGEVLREMRVRPGETATFDFPLAHAGQTVVELDSAEAEGELSNINNRAVLAINGVRERLRVLLVSGEPHPGERTWRTLLKSDPSVDLVHFTILRPPEKQDGTPIRELSLIAFPIRELFELKLKEFDLIIFDRYRRRGVLPRAYLDNIAAYVEEGGALLEAVGPTFATPLSLFRSPLGRVLPGEPTGDVTLEGYHATISDIGQRHPVTAGLPGGDSEPPEWGRWFRQVGVIPNSGTVLLDGAGGQPLLILDRVGEGRVAQLMTDHLWLWARGFEGGGPQSELLRRMAHWLMKEPALEEERLSAETRGDRLVIKRSSLEQPEAPVEVTAPDGMAIKLPLEDKGGGVSEAVLPADLPGVYRISSDGLTALAAVGALNPVEYRSLISDTEIIRGPVEASGGTVRRLTDGLPELRRVREGAALAGRGWVGLVANHDYVVTGIRRVSLAPPFLALAVVIGLLLLAWRREGR